MDSWLSGPLRFEGACVGGKIFVEWKDSPEQATFRSSVREFLQTRLPAYYRDHESRRHEASGLENNWQQDLHNGSPEAKAAAQEWADALAEKGWGQPHWP